jgi:tetratricopeptide (TPR) repeat protein
MFFPRLRNQAKWAFALLILIFGGGFIFLGVGSGGLDLGQLLRDAFGNKGPSTGSVSQAEQRVRERPFNAPARKNLADVLEKKGRLDEAIAAWEGYIKLRPKDTTALRHVAQLELGQADRYRQEAQLAAVAQQEAGANSVFTPSSSSTFGRSLGTNPIASAVSTKVGAQFQQAYAKYQTAGNQAVATYQQIVTITPRDQQALLSLAQAADTVQKREVAIAAYKRVLALGLDQATASQIRQRIKTLQQSTAGSSG